MRTGFYAVMTAQFFSALADNALLICAIAILNEVGQGDDKSLLKALFAISYVVLAAFVGAFSDSMAKRRVMLISNSIKIAGCALLYFGVSPLFAYAVVGLGAAIYSPAKYGIVTELLPPSKLVIANSWIEGLTVGAIIFGTLLGGRLVAPEFMNPLINQIIPVWVQTLLGTFTQVGIVFVGLLYLIAAIFNLYIPDTGVDHKPLHKNPLYLIREFWHCNLLLWRDKLGQISLAVTTLFWGVGATLQFIVIDWAEYSLNMKLEHSTMIQGVVAIGVTLGAVTAAKIVTLRKSVAVIPVGILMGLIVPIMVLIPFVPSEQLGQLDFMLGDKHIHMAITLRITSVMLLMLIVGGLSGLFVVPMNALLQHRGHTLMGAGHSIAVQNFNEHISILAMTALYAFLIKYVGMNINTIIIAFGFSVAACMWLVRVRFLANQREKDDVIHLPDHMH